MKYAVRLELFEGPLDLLLFLICKDEIDIYDIPIAEITKQYLDYVRLMEDLDIELAADYFVMAADLLKIKSEMLMPRKEPDSDKPYDPRIVLVGQLLEYQRFREVSEQLSDLAQAREDEYSRGSFVGDGEMVERLEVTMDIYGLLMTFREVLERYRRLEPLEIEAPRVSVGERADEIVQVLAKNQGSLTLENLIEFFLASRDYIRVELIVTLLAILELVKQARVKIRQPESFQTISIQLA